MKRLFLSIVLFAAVSFSSGKPSLKPADFKILEGEKWTGKLTYLDYTSHKQVTIPADLIVRQSEKNPRVWIFKNEYPKEPHANNEDTVRISESGDTIDGEKVVERTTNGTDGLKIITKKTENETQFRFTYLISKARLSIRTEEKGASDKVFFERNKYEYSRKKK